MTLISTHLVNIRIQASDIAYTILYTVLVGIDVCRAMCIRLFITCLEVFFITGLKIIDKRSMTLLHMIEVIFV